MGYDDLNDFDLDLEGVFDSEPPFIDALDSSSLLDVRITPLSSDLVHGLHLRDITVSSTAASVTANNNFNVNDIFLNNGQRQNVPPPPSTQPNDTLTSTLGHSEGVAGRKRARSGAQSARNVAEIHDNSLFSQSILTKNEPNDEEILSNQKKAASKNIRKAKIKPPQSLKSRASSVSLSDDGSNFTSQLSASGANGPPPIEIEPREEIDYTGMSASEIAHAKKTRRRKQIAKASRLSRARKKEELERLREQVKLLTEQNVKLEEENDVLKRSQAGNKLDAKFLNGKFTELNNFDAAFKQLCKTDNNNSIIGNGNSQKSNPVSSMTDQATPPDFRPISIQSLQRQQQQVSNNGLTQRHNNLLRPERSLLYEKGAKMAHEQVLVLLSQSVDDNWHEALIPEQVDIPYDDFKMYFKFQADFSGTTSDIPQSVSTESLNSDFISSGVKQRLAVRMDLSYEGLDSVVASEFLWSSLWDTSQQQRLYGINDIEVTQLASPSIDSDPNTKLFYYKETYAHPIKSRDWVALCNQRHRNLPAYLLQSPGAKVKAKGEKDCMVLSLSTWASNTAPSNHNDEVNRELSLLNVPDPIKANTHRIRSLFIQGAAVYRDKANAMLSVVFSFPDDFEIKAVKGFRDIIHPDGTVTLKFANIIKEFYNMMEDIDVDIPTPTKRGTGMSDDIFS